MVSPWAWAIRYRPSLFPRAAFAQGAADSARFQVVAGTLNRHKRMHHLAAVLGLCRRAADIECLGAFSKNKAQEKRTATDAASCSGASMTVALLPWA